MKIKTKKLLNDNFDNIPNDSTSYDIVGAFVEDIMKHENVSYNDILPAGNGKTCKNLKIGKYILKVGETRRTTQIPNHFRILQPVIRREIPMSKPDEKLFIEVQDEVEKDWYKQIPPENINKIMYQIYKDFRDAGLVWTDIRFTNIGKLKKPNIAHYQTNSRENTEIIPSTISTGLKGTPSKTLDTGEHVVLDTDFIFEEKEIKKMGGLKKVLLPIYYENYEQRYQKEKAVQKEVE